ncbi:alpha/beta hydrolase [Sphingomonas sp. DT-204]|uniref:alpha/beta hydrolase n=1 Tax=Sphingomonas sp. DT-204 TaxID=3396166 RepID=UPI003F19FDEF
MRTIDRRTAILGTIGGALAATEALAQTKVPPVDGAGASAGLPQPTETIELWPKGAPGMPAKPPAEVTIERSTDASLNNRTVAGVVRPRLLVFRPAVPNGAAMLLMPGGGYVLMAVDKEGFELGRYLAARGFTAFVLLYRLPGDGWAAGPDVVLQDVQRAMRVIRGRADRYGVDPNRVAAMGFSAGGHACADLVARFAFKSYDPVDAADGLSARPFVAAPIYPVVGMDAPIAHMGSRRALLGETPTPEMIAAHSPDRNIRSDSPPCFLCAAEDDATVPVENTLLLRAALRAAKVPAETHLFTSGGHGFGLRGVVGKPAGAWPELFLAWSRSQGLF